jgi:hypothetical protein
MKYTTKMALLCLACLGVAYLVLSRLVVSCVALSRLILSCRVLPYIVCLMMVICLALPYLTPSRVILSCFVLALPCPLPCPCLVLPCLDPDGFRKGTRGGSGWLGCLILVSSIVYSLYLYVSFSSVVLSTFIVSYAFHPLYCCKHQHKEGEQA